MPAEGVMTMSTGVALTVDQRTRILALAEATIPHGERVDGASCATMDRFEAWLGGVPTGVARLLVNGYLALDLSTVPSHGTCLSKLPPSERRLVLSAWERSEIPLRRAALRALVTPLKFAHFDRPDVYARMGCRLELEQISEAKPRFFERVIDGRSLVEPSDLECEVVVIGTGAGGAAAGYELAARGRAVLMLEEGEFHRRPEFRANTGRAYRELYRGSGDLMALGNVIIPLFAGRSVGGSTTINSGTCYRTPPGVLSKWRTQFGLPNEFSPTGLGPYFDRVESMLNVGLAPARHLGATAPIVARSAGRLGMSHGPLQRNAPGCDGQGVCCFGCPTGAKRSTDVSYVPSALLRGAELVTSARVDTIDMVAGHVRGVTARTGPAGSTRLRVKADAVMVASGTLATPSLLRRSGICRTRNLGKNLSLHPASKVFALFDAPVDQWQGIPQGYAVDEYAEEGLLFEGANMPLNVASIAVPWTGQRYVEIMEKYRNLASFGFMIRDVSRGEVHWSSQNEPRIAYRLGEADTRLLQRGVEILCEIFQNGGARRVLPMLPKHDEVSTPTDLDRLRSTRLAATDFELTAYHPLGTCRVGEDAGACITSEHEVRDAKGVYVCDGSAVPSSLGANPQVTIMALALRVGEIVDARLDAA